MDHLTECLRLKAERLSFFVGVISVFMFSVASPLIGWSKNLESCLLESAIYEPNSKNEYRQKMYISAAEDENPARKYFFYFNYYAKNESLAMQIRLAYGCSNGVSVCRVSSYYGQYSSMNELSDFKKTLNLEVVALDKDFLSAPLGLQMKAPHAIVFPNAKSSFYYNDWSSAKKYIKFFLKEDFDPAFSGEDVWILKGRYSKKGETPWQR